MDWFHSHSLTFTKSRVSLGLATVSMLALSIMGTISASAALPILPSIPIPAPKGTHVEVRYHTTMKNKAGKSVQVGSSMLASQLNGTAPVGPGMKQGSTKDQLMSAPNNPANIKTMSQHLIPTQTSTSNQPGLAAFKTNVPLTAQQEAVAKALTSRFAPDKSLTPMQVLKPTFEHLKKQPSQ